MGSVSLTRLFGLPDLSVFTGALCADPIMDPDVWFSEETSRQRVAARVCGHCPLGPGPKGNNKCMEGALSMEASTPTRAFGVWGGLTAADRDALGGRIYTNEADLWADVLWGTEDLFEGDE